MISMEKYIMALDQGTTSSRCILFDKRGNICSMSQKEFTQIYPKPGWVEHNPKEIWSSQLAVAAECMAMAGAGAEQIAAIGITNQRETTIVWDKNTGEPIYNAIVWQCRRTADRIEALKKDGFDLKIREKTGLVPDAYFSASKIAWILQEVPGTMERAKKGELLFGTVDTWLIWNLTKGRVHATDYTNASRTMLFDIHRLAWDEEIMERFGIPTAMLPRVYPSSHVFGHTDSSVLGGEIPIAGAAGDQQAALFGQCCFEKGEVKNTYGTGCFLLMNTGTDAIVSKSGLLTTIAAGTSEKPEYALEGSVFVAGAGVQWLRDSMRMIRNAPQSQSYCEAVEDTAGVYMVPAFAGMGAPYWNQYARGTVVGLTRGCTKEHFIRAALESIAYQTADVLQAMEQDSGISLKSLKVDGGASANDFLMQFQADIVDTQVLRPECIETTALGAAYLAGLAVGYWQDQAEIRANWQIGHTFEPVMEAQKRGALLKGWKRAVKCALAWAEDEEGSGD
jgi:glycerol kinase